MKKIKIIVIIALLVIFVTSINIYATTNSNSINNTINTGVTTQSEIDDMVEYVSESGLTKSNLAMIIEKYKELSKKYTNEQLADMLDTSVTDLKGKNIDTSNINNINTVLRNFTSEQLNDILNKIDIDQVLNDMSSGSTLFDVVTKATSNLSVKDKAGLAWSILTTGKIFHIIITIIIIFEIYKLFTRCVIYKKAKRHAWAVLVPIYRDVTMLKICRMSPWWLLLLLVPIVGWALLWVVSVASKFMLAENFGKSEWFGLGLWLLWPIFESILVFSKKTKYLKIDC